MFIFAYRLTVATPGSGPHRPTPRPGPCQRFPTIVRRPTSGASRSCPAASSSGPSTFTGSRSPGVPRTDPTSSIGSRKSSKVELSGKKRSPSLYTYFGMISPSRITNESSQMAGYLYKSFAMWPLRDALFNSSQILIWPKSSLFCRNCQKLIISFYCIISLKYKLCWRLFKLLKYLVLLSK